MKTFTHSKNNKFIWVTIMDLQEKHYLCETNQAFCNICDKILCLSMSCAWLRKFQKRLKKAVQDHKRKLLNVNILHFLFDFVQLSEYDLYLLKWIAADIQWCMPDASKLKKTLPNDINQDDIFDYIKKHDLIEKVDLIEYDKIRQNLLL